jgi:hypothetical protein
VSESPQEPLVEVEAGRISRPDSTRFFFRADDDGGAPSKPATPPDDWRSLRLREALAQRAEPVDGRDETTFRLPWSELLKAMVEVLRATDDGAGVDRDAPTLIDYDPNEETRIQPPFQGDDSQTLCTPGGAIPAAGGGEETVIQASPELVAAQQEAAYLEGKLTRLDGERRQLAERLTNAEEAADAAAMQLERAEQARERALRDGDAARDLAEQFRLEIKQLEADLDAEREGSDRRAVEAEEAAAAATAERDVALTGFSAAQEQLREAHAARDQALAGHQEAFAALQETQGALEETSAALRSAAAAQREAEAGREEAEAARQAAVTAYEAARVDAATVRQRLAETLAHLEGRIAGLEEELQRRTAGHERERDALLEDVRESERMMRELFGKLPEAELRGWVPGLEREPWCEETAIRHLACLLERLDALRSERRQARLLPVPDFEQMLARIEAGRADAPASQQPRLARLKHTIERAGLQFEALRDAHLARQAKLGELVELQAVVAQALAHERELAALGL